MHPFLQRLELLLCLFWTRCSGFKLQSLPPQGTRGALVTANQSKVCYTHVLATICIAGALTLQQKPAMRTHARGLSVQGFKALTFEFSGVCLCAKTDLHFIANVQPCEADFRFC